jgi:hypothetical protein
MGPLDFLNHLLNFLAPALAVAAGLALFDLVFSKKRPLPIVFWSQLAINFVVGLGVLVAGLVLLGRDGKMLTYLALLLATATSQGLQLGGWRRQGRS